MTLEKNVISKIRKIAEKQEMSQAALADLCGVAQPQVSKLFSGKTVRSDAIFRMLERLGAKIIFPGESPTSLSTDEANRVDQIVTHLREIGISNEAICQTLLAELPKVFGVETEDTKPEERKRAS